MRITWVTGDITTQEVDAVVNEGKAPLASFAGLGRVPPASELDGTA